MDALPKTDTITLKSGTKHQLQELTFGDLVDLEERSIDLEDMMKAGADGKATVKSRKGLGTILWMLVRHREAASDPWEPMEEDFLHSLTLTDFQAVMPTMMKFMAAPFGDEEGEGTG